MITLALAAALALPPQDSGQWRLIGMGGNIIFGADAGSVRRDGDTASITGVLVYSEGPQGAAWAMTHNSFDCTARTAHVGSFKVHAADGSLIRAYNLDSTADLGGPNSVMERQFVAACEDQWDFEAVEDTDLPGFIGWSQDLIDEGILDALARRSAGEP